MSELQGGSAGSYPRPIGVTATGQDAVLAALSRMEQRLVEIERTAALIAPLAGLIDNAPGAVAAVVDTVDSVAARVAEQGPGFDERLRAAVRVLDVATSPRALDGLTAVLGSRLLDPAALAIVSQLANALANPTPTPPVGVWGAMRSLSDPDVQRALGFLLGVARAFGKNLAAGEVDACRDRLIATQSAEATP